MKLNAILLLAGMTLSSFFGYTQVLQLGNDTTICGGAQITLVSTAPDSNLFLFVPDMTTIDLEDDQYSGVIPIGFNFSFYDSTHSHLLIGSNGVVTFDTVNANQYCPWAIDQAIPTAAYHKNSIMAPLMDLTSSTIIKYGVVGTAPNRQFVVMYFPIAYSCNISCWLMAVTLSETSNEIEIHLKNKPLCNTWNNGAAIEGIQNIDGTVAHVVSGRNYPVSWSCGSDGKKFTPSGPANYTITDIPYSYVIDSTFEIYWSVMDVLYPYTDSLTVTIDPNQIGYAFVGVASSDLCPDLPVALSDSSTIVSGSGVSFSPVITHETCMDADDGMVTVNISATALPVTFTWEGNVTNQTTFTNLAPGTYTFSAVDANGCSGQGSVTILGSSQPLSATYSTTQEVQGGDGTLTATTSGGTPPYIYSLGGPFQSSSFFDDLPGGTYTLTVHDVYDCVFTMTVTVPSVVGMNEQTAGEISFWPNPVKNELHLQAGEQVYTVAVYTVAGKKCLETTVSGNQSIDLSKLQPGMYSIIFKSGNGVDLFGKLIKE
ncbi:MAG TPA: T9SS type A sorting domain-containing protein [Fluviicola sp.]|nr:T9SS type A sorting domain-containing protein [Fluviicola sp.]